MKERLTRYLKKYLSDYAFVELSEEFLDRLGVSDILKDIPVPIKKDDIKDVTDGGISPARLGERMIFVIGCDPGFRYAHEYSQYLVKAFDNSLITVILSEAGRYMEKEEYYNACIGYRGAVVLGGGLEALYGYALSVRNIYLASDDEEEIGNFKAESIECFEKLTMEYPEFAPGHYYLGYAYLNLGLYTKAKLAWEDFVHLSESDMYEQNSHDAKFMTDALTEIQGRLIDLQEPVKIEEGCNHVMAGRFDKGIKVLEPFAESKAAGWWPIHYYLGVAYFRCGILDKAEARFKDALKLDPSNAGAMKELAGVYEYLHDEKAEKYRKKAKVIEERM